MPASAPPSIAPTLALARIMGPLLFIFGLAMALGRIQVGALFHAFFDNAAMVFIGGFMVLLLGLIVVTLHNVWRTPTQILVTLLGWVMCLRGAVLLFAPQAIRALGEPLVANPTFPLIGGLVAAVLGAWFSYIGFFTGEPKS